MANISNEKLKEMEAEMNRFEQEISGNFGSLFGAGGAPPPPPPPPPGAPETAAKTSIVRPPPPPPPPRPSLATRFLPPQLLRQQQQQQQHHHHHPPRPAANIQPPPPPPPPPPPAAAEEPPPRPRFAPIGGPPRPPPPQQPRPFHPQHLPPPPPPPGRPPQGGMMGGQRFPPPPPPGAFASKMEGGTGDGPVLEKPKMVYSAPPQLKRPRAPSPDPSASSEPPASSSSSASKTTVSAAPSREPPEGPVPSSSAPAQSVDDAMEIEPEAIKQDTLVSLTPQLAKRAGNKKLAANRQAANRPPKKQKFLRQAAGHIWEDTSLAEWDGDDFRLFCGDLGNEVNDDVLTRAFSKYASFQKAKVVRDRRTNKSKGYGFVSFKDPNDFTRAVREMNGKYVGNRPIKLRKSQWRDRQLDVVRKKEKEKRKLGLKV